MSKSIKTYTAKTPLVLRKLFPKYQWRFSSTEKELFLTFDDGPTPQVTEFVLDQLAKYNAKATFFCIGKNALQQSNLYQRIIEDGHAVGNHTHNHMKGWKNKKGEYIANVEKAAKVIHSSLFRPPYGKIRKKQAKALIESGYKIIMWDVLSGDFDTTISREKCLNNVIENTESGSIVVFHDSIKAQKRIEYALPKVLEYFTKKGYLFKAIS
ncbi:MAG: polysaccharide deacetylase family protein [Flavobacteriaceae bacterium]